MEIIEDEETYEEKYKRTFGEGLRYVSICPGCGYISRSHGKKKTFKKRCPKCNDLCDEKEVSLTQTETKRTGTFYLIEEKAKRLALMNEVAEKKEGD